MKRGMRLVTAGVVGLLMLAVVATMVASVRAGGLWWPGFAFGPVQTFQFEERVPFAVKRLLVRNPVGRVAVMGGGTPGEIGVRASVRIRSARGVDPGAGLNTFLAVEPRGGVLELDARRQGGYAYTFFGYTLGADQHLDLTLTVPDGVELEIRADLGRVDLRNVSGAVSITADLGEVVVAGFRGDLAIDTDMGSVRIVDAEMVGPLKLESDMGDIRFVGDPGPSSTITTSLGDITLALPVDRAYQIVARSETGDVEYEIPHDDGRIGEGAVRGTIHISTRMGAVRIIPGSESDGL